MDASVVRATARGGRERQLANRLVSLHRRAMRGRGGGEREKRKNAFGVVGKKLSGEERLPSTQPP